MPGSPRCGIQTQSSKFPRRGPRLPGSLWTILGFLIWRDLDSLGPKVEGSGLLGPELGTPGPLHLRSEGARTAGSSKGHGLGLGSRVCSSACTPQVPFSCGSSSWSCSETGSVATASAGLATAASSSCVTPERWGSLPDAPHPARASSRSIWPGHSVCPLLGPAPSSYFSPPRQKLPGLTRVQKVPETAPPAPPVRCQAPLPPAFRLSPASVLGGAAVG